MKISLLATAVIIAIAAAFGLQQRSKIQKLTTEWNELKETAISKDVSTDPEATFNSKRVITDARRMAREDAVKDFAKEIIDFAVRMKAARENDDGTRSEVEKEALGFIDKLVSLQPSDFELLIATLQQDTSIDKEAKRDLIMMSIMMISSEHPETALSLASATGKEFGESDQIEYMLPMILSQYAAKDLNGAAGWLLENEEKLGSEKSEQMKAAILSMSARSNLKSALSMIDTLGFENPTQTLGQLGVGVNPGDQGAFLKAIEDRNFDEEQRKTAISGLAHSPLMKDFSAATEWLDSPQLGEADRKTIIDSLSYQTVKENPGEWLDWVAKDETGSSDATTNILSGWARADYISAGQWLQNQKPGPTKETAVHSYADTLAPYEPAAAAQWAETLPAGDDRTNLLQTIHSNLKKKDPVAAQALAAKHNLTQ